MSVLLSPLYIQSLLSNSARDEGARLEEERGILRLEVIQNALHKDVPKQHLLWLVGMQASFIGF